MLLSFPCAPIAAMLVLVLVVGVARLMFTGTIRIGGTPNAPVAASITDQAAATGTAKGSGPGASGARSGEGAEEGAAYAASGGAASGDPAATVLVVAGWGSSCCDAANALRAATPGVAVRQFSYAGLNAKGQPLPSGPAADDLPLPELGDRIAAQVTALHRLTGGRVDVVAESEGTLGVYAMLDRNPGLPVGAVVLLSPIMEPGQLGGAPAGGGLPVPEYALDTVNALVGSMSPYGPDGAGELLSSVGEFGAAYFERVVTGAGTGIRLLAVVPLADALTLSDCGLSRGPNVLLVPAFHGGLLGDAGVLSMVSAFLAGRTAGPPGPSAQQEDSLRTEAEVLSGAAAAWRMPQTDPGCP